MDKLVSELFGLCPTIIEMYDNMKDNDERCRRIADRVRALEGLVLTVKERGSGRNSGAVEKALKELHTILKHAEKLVSKFSKNNRLKQFMMSGSIGAKFSEVNQRLTENFQMLSGALQVEQSDILHKVYETVLGRPYTPLPNPPCPMFSPAAPPIPSPPVPAAYIMAPMRASTPVLAQPFCKTTTVRVLVSNNMPPMPVIRTISPVSVVRTVSPIGFRLY